MMIVKKKEERWMRLMLLAALVALCLWPATSMAQIVETDDTEEVVTDDDDEDADDGDEEGTDTGDEVEEAVEEEFPQDASEYMDDSTPQYSWIKLLTADNDCRTSDVNPEYTKEEYVERLLRMPTVIEMPWNDVVKACIDRYVVRGRRQVSYLLGACNFYMPLFEQALEAYQMPLELKYLPIIESALNPTAVSHAGAAGLWQFMPSTGKTYGLEMNSLVDERRDPVKSSYAAARLLRDLYNQFGDWHLAIAGYNCGPENINKAIRRSGGEKDYWKIYPYLPRETRGYVPAFIAANYVMNYYCEHNICPMQAKLPTKTDTVMLDRNVSFTQISTVCGFDIDMIRSLNPQYRRDVIPGQTKPSALRLPADDILKFIDLQDSVYACREGAFDKRAEVEIDERLIVKSSKRKGRKGRSSRVGRAAKGGRSVTVRKGDTLSSIAKRNGTTVAKLRKLNGIKGNNIQSGKKLKVR